MKKILFTACVGVCHAWEPGSSVSPSVSGFTVDKASRSDVLSFYHHIYKASETDGILTGWMGNQQTCSEGELSNSFVQAMQRRVNYYRAMAGVTGNTSMNTNSLAVPAAVAIYNAPAGTTKVETAQKAALLLSNTGLLTHTPAIDASCYTAAAANGSFNGNIALDLNGIRALDYYMKENADNLHAGHRRFMIADEATNFATGDVSRRGDFKEANALYVHQGEGEKSSPAAKFVPWPNGHTPWDHSTPYWSLSYMGANFTNATTVTVTRGGLPVATEVVNRATGFGSNTIVWKVNDFPQVQDDVTYHVTVARISGSGPASHSYTVTFFDPNRIPDGPVVSGSLTPRHPSENFSFSATAGADDYLLEVGRLDNATFLEGAEDATASSIINGPVTDYLLRQTENKQSGLKAFRLTFSDYATQNKQWFQLDRLIVPSTNASIVYHLQRAFMLNTWFFSVEYSTDSVNWIALPGSVLAGNDGTTLVDSTFQRRSIALPAELVNQSVSFRFALSKSDLSAYDIEDPFIGAFVDSISFTNCRSTVTSKQTTIPKTTNQFAFNADTSGGALQNAQYLLRVRPRFASSYLSAGNALIVTGDRGTPNIQPTLGVIANPSPINEDAGLQSIALSGISAGTGESQPLTVTASSSNPALILNPVVEFNPVTLVATVRYTPAANQSGSTVITVTVNDGQTERNTISRTFTVVVNPVDDAPECLPILAQQLDEDGAINVPVTISDVDTAVAGAMIRATSSNAVLLPTTAISYSGTGTSRILGIRPAANQHGTATVTLTVTNAGKTATRTFQVTVNSLNDAPFITTPPVLRPILEDARPVTITISGISPGLFETQAITIRAESSNKAIMQDPTIILGPNTTTATMTYTPVPNQSGRTSIRLTLNDGATANNIRVYELLLDITPVDDATDIQPVSAQQLDEDTFINVPLTLTDIDNTSDFVGTSLRVTSNNTTLLPVTQLALSGSGANRSLRITPAANRNGSATISVTVTNKRLSAVRTFQVTVNPVNDAPLITTLPVLRPILEDTQPVKITISGISPGLFETQALSINAESLNTAIMSHPTILHKPNTTTATMTYIPVANQSGRTTIRLTLNDGAATNKIRVYELPIDITPVDDAPTISAIAPVSARVNTAIPQISYNIADIDHAIADLVVKVASSNVKLLPASGISMVGSGSERTLRLSPLPNVTGSTNVTITVTSGKLTTTRTFAVAVTPVGK